MPTPTPTPDIARAAISEEHLALADTVRDAYVLSIGTPDEWSMPTLSLRIAGAIKIAADRAADAVHDEYAPRCKECGGKILGEIAADDVLSLEGFDTEECRTAHYNALANEAARDNAIDAFRDARAERRCA